MTVSGTAQGFKLEINIRARTQTRVDPLSSCVYYSAPAGCSVISALPVPQRFHSFRSRLSPNPEHKSPYSVRNTPIPLQALCLVYIKSKKPSEKYSWTVPVSKYVSVLETNQQARPAPNSSTPARRSIPLILDDAQVANILAPQTSE